ncbi:MAG TPA: N-acetyltransferase [Candidatus Stackebrandtia faecavium]|nr:N-acetyltransferase [Candidatus Stackebrandtia faecavium]
MDATVIDNPDLSRYEAKFGDEIAGYCQYEHFEKYTRLPHTVVSPEYRGQGIAGELVRAAMDDLRARGIQVEPSCTYVQRWLAKHPEYNDMVHSS